MVFYYTTLSFFSHYHNHGFCWHFTSFCRQASDEFQVLANSYWYNPEATPTVYFAMVDYDDATDAFQSVSRLELPLGMVCIVLCVTWQKCVSHVNNVCHMSTMCITWQQCVSRVNNVCHMSAKCVTCQQCVSHVNNVCHMSTMCVTCQQCVSLVNNGHNMSTMCVTWQQCGSDDYGILHGYKWLQCVLHDCNRCHMITVRQITAMCRMTTMFHMLTMCR